MEMGGRGQRERETFYDFMQFPIIKERPIKNKIFVAVVSRR